MYWNVLVTEVVPAPEDPVTATTGCFAACFSCVVAGYGMRNRERVLNSDES